MSMQLHQGEARHFLLQSPTVHPNILGISLDYYQKVVWEVILIEGYEQRVGADFEEWGLWRPYSLSVQRTFGLLRNPFRKHLCMVQLRTSQAFPFPYWSFPFQFPFPWLWSSSIMNKKSMDYLIFSFTSWYILFKVIFTSLHVILITINNLKRYCWKNHLITWIIII